MKDFLPFSSNYAYIYDANKRHTSLQVPRINSLSMEELGHNVMPDEIASA